MASRLYDLKSSLVLGVSLAISAAATVPLLLPSLPAAARTLPVPLPVFCFALAGQMLVVYGLFGFAGFRMARGRGFDAAPQLSEWWRSGRLRLGGSRVGSAFVVGIASGLALVAAIALIKTTLPHTLPQTLHPLGLAAALLASLTASIGEEVLFRLFLLSSLIRLLPDSRKWRGLAVALSALAFAAAHAPAAVFLFGGLHEVPLLSWVWVMVLNGCLGVVFGMTFLRGGILCAISAHLGTDVVWHVLSQALSR